MNLGILKGGGGRGVGACNCKILAASAWGRDFNIESFEKFAKNRTPLAPCPKYEPYVVGFEPMYQATYQAEGRACRPVQGLIPDLIRELRTHREVGLISSIP